MQNKYIEIGYHSALMKAYRKNNLEPVRKMHKKMNFWKKIQNPWKAIKKGCYVLDNEKDAAEKDKYKFHTNLPPQPFQGNPEAPIWILMLNPCYSTDDAKYYAENTKRRNAILGQLQFRKTAEHFHYVLDNAQNNFSRDWFEKRFIKNKDMGITADNVDKKVFILQACGYASEKFNGDLKKMANDFPHMKFAQKLARWGLKNGKKIVIARSCAYWLDVLNIEKKSKNIKKNKKNVYFFSSNMNIVFSSNNILNLDKEQSGVSREQNKMESAAELKDIIKK